MGGLQKADNGKYNTDDSTSVTTTEHDKRPSGCGLRGITASCKSSSITAHAEGHEVVMDRYLGKEAGSLPADATTASVAASSTTSVMTEQLRGTKESVASGIVSSTVPSLPGDGARVICEQKDGTWTCQLYYKRELILKQIMLHQSAPAGRRAAILKTLKDFGVKVTVLDGSTIQTTADLLDHVRRVVGFVARENRILAASTLTLGYQRCLLYQDESGKLFNMLLAPHAAGPAGTWQEYLDTFSGLEAIIALTVLCRSFPCVTEVDSIDTLKPAYLSLILGVVLSEEISFSWLNASMLVRATPSVSGHTLICPIGSDILRRALVFCLALAGAATGMAQKVLTFVGIAGACMVLLVNLGSRAWHFLKWKPLRYDGLGASLVVYLAAMGTGVVVPYMGHRTIEAGGKAATEHVLRTSLIVAVVFVISDLDEVQKFLVVGSEECNQSFVNVAVGCWWTVTLIISVLLVRRLPTHYPQPADGELLLKVDHASPVGYKVPNLPDFEIDPTVARTGTRCLPLLCELVAGITMAVVVGAAIVYLGFTDWDESLIANAQAYAADMF